MAMSTPGMFLSQPGSEMLASYHWARMTVSMESAIMSRETSDAFHALGAHGDAVADADGVEDQADQIGILHALLDLGGPGR